MRKNLFILAAISIGLVVTAVLSGIYFASPPAQPSSLGPGSALVDPVADLYSFGDDDKYAVLLDLAAAQVRSESTLILTAAASSVLLPDETICTHSGVSVSAPPVGAVKLSGTQDGQPQPIWHQLSDWLNAPFQDHYVVTLWVPDNQHKSFTLVSGDAPTSPVVCTQQVEKDV